MLLRVDCEELHNMIVSPLSCMLWPTVQLLKMLASLDFRVSFLLKLIEAGHSSLTAIVLNCLQTHADLSVRFTLVSQG